MYFTEYAVAARTHYKSCRFIYESCIDGNGLKPGGDKDVLYRLLYLAGHIVECAAIYLIYSHFKYDYHPTLGGWNGKTAHLHKSYNRTFTRKSHLDFYPIKKQQGKLVSTCRKTPEGEAITFGKEDDGVYYNIQSHDFQKYIKNIIHPHLPQDVPYLRPSCPQDREYEEAITLIDTWKPDLRYYYEGRRSGHYNLAIDGKLPEVNAKTIASVLDICGKIVALMPSGRQL